MYFFTSYYRNVERIATTIFVKGGTIYSIIVPITNLLIEILQMLAFNGILHHLIPTYIYN